MAINKKEFSNDFTKKTEIKNNDRLLITDGNTGLPFYSTIEEIRDISKDGEDGADGYTPIKGVDYFDGLNGKTIEVFKIDKVGGYNAGDQIFENGVLYEVKVGQSLSMGQKPSENLTKVNIIFNVGDDSFENFKTNINNILDIEVNPNGAVELIPFISSGGGNSSYSNSSNFIYQNHHLLNSHFIKGIKVLVSVGGSFTVSIVENAGTAEFSIIEEIPITLQAGEEYYEINKQLTSTQTLAFAKQGDTGIFKYLSGVNQVGGYFRQRNNITGAWSNSGNGNLNIGVYIEGETTGSKTIDDIYSKLGSQSVLKNKKVVLFGDSITTFSGYITSGNATFYPTNNVTNVDDTWWKKLMDFLGANLILNDSWSGSRISNTGSGSLQTRLERTPEDADYVIIFMGTNDLGNSVTFGDIDLVNPFTLTEFTDAYCNALDWLTTNRPNAKIICLSPLRRYVSSTGELYSRSSQTSDTYSQRIKDIAYIYCCEFIDLRELGINSKNQSTYLFDGLHPNKKGMTAIFEFLARKF